MKKTYFNRAHIFILIALVAIVINTQLLSIVTGYKLIDFHFGHLDFGVAAVGIIFFPIIYTCEDAITELFGSKTAKFVVWMTLGTILVFCLLVKFAIHLAPARDWIGNQAMFKQVLEHTWRMGLATLIGLPVAEFLNVYILAKWKIFWKGRYYFIRSVGSTCVGELIDTVIAYFVAFYGDIRTILVFKLILIAYILKIIYTIVSATIATPVVRLIKNKLKLDNYDQQVFFNPFNFR